MKISLPALALAIMAAAIAAASTAPANARRSAPLASVEELPIDKFDEYQAGSIPPPPWTTVGTPADGVTLALQAAAESPFVGNRETGKGLAMRDASTSAGGAYGIERRFTPPPAGAQFLAFDFRLGTGDGAESALTLSAQLLDSRGDGLKLSASVAKGLSLESKAGTRQVASLGAGKWYHCTVQLDENRRATITLTPFPSKSPSATARDIELPSSSGFTDLRFANGGPDSEQGSWSVDNVLMAGQVDAPRAAWWPFDQEPIDKLRAYKKKVFVYYFPIYTAGPTSEDPSLSWYSRTIMNPTIMNKPDRVDAGTEFEYCPLQYPPLPALAEKHAERVRQMEHEIAMARQMGIDGFFVDIQAFEGPGGAAYFNEMAFSMMEAAAKVDPGFAIIPAIYGPEQATDDTARSFANSPIVKRVLAQPNVLRTPDGRVVVSSWYPERYPASWWKKAFDVIAGNGTKVAFVPQFNSIDHLTEFAPISYGMNNWGPRTPGKYDWVSRIEGLTETTISPVVVEDIRTRGAMYFESCNSDLFRDLWNSAIGDDADWVFVDTWSDYTEQAQAPSRSIGFAPFDIDAYYTQWFKTGQQPEIKRDVFYYFYRIHHADAVPAHGKQWTLRQAWGKNAGSVPESKVELLAFLKLPGELTIEIAGKKYTQSAKAGITSFKVPFPPGVAFDPVFTLRRGGKTVISRAGQYSVLDKIEYGNMLYHSGVIATGMQ